MPPQINHMFPKASRTDVRERFNRKAFRDCSGAAPRDFEPDVPGGLPDRRPGTSQQRVASGRPLRGSLLSLARTPSREDERKPPRNSPTEPSGTPPGLLRDSSGTPPGALREHSGSFREPSGSPPGPPPGPLPPQGTPRDPSGTPLWGPPDPSGGFPAPLRDTSCGLIGLPGGSLGRTREPRGGLERITSESGPKEALGGTVSEPGGAARNSKIVEKPMVFQ